MGFLGSCHFPCRGFPPVKTQPPPPNPSANQDLAEQCNATAYEAHTSERKESAEEVKKAKAGWDGRGLDVAWSGLEWIWK